MKNLMNSAIAGLTAATLASPVAADCFDLAPHIPPGPFFGTSIQVDSNTVISLTPTQFWWDPATPATSGPDATMEPNECFGGPSALNLNNTNLTVQISQRDPDVKQFQMNFCDFGGFENVSASPANPPAFIGDIPNVPPVLIDAHGDPVDVLTSLAPPEGKLVFRATNWPITYMRAGGQEFFVHGFCIN